VPNRIPLFKYLLLKEKVSCAEVAQDPEGGITVRREERTFQEKVSQKQAIACGFRKVIGAPEVIGASGAEGRDSRRCRRKVAGRC
jgi:hypothetical protein